MINCRNNLGQGKGPCFICLCICFYSLYFLLNRKFNIIINDINMKNIIVIIIIIIIINIIIITTIIIIYILL